MPHQRAGVRQVEASELSAIGRIPRDLPAPSQPNGLAIPRNSTSKIIAGGKCSDQPTVVGLFQEHGVPVTAQVHYAPNAIVRDCNLFAEGGSAAHKGRRV